MQRPWGHNSWACPRNCQNTHVTRVQMSKREMSEIKAWEVQKGLETAGFYSLESLKDTKQGMTGPHLFFKKMKLQVWVRESTRWGWNISLCQKAKTYSESDENISKGHRGHLKEHPMAKSGTICTKIRVILINHNSENKINAHEFILNK